MKTEIHPSKTGLESRFEEELARADRKYVNPDTLKIDETHKESKPSRESKESLRMEEAMHLRS